MAIWGSGVSEHNPRLRFYVFCFLCIGALAALLYWQDQLNMSQDYVDFSASKQTKIKKADHSILTKSVTPEGE